MELIEQCILPDWPAPPSVRALQTTRRGGVSQAPYDTLNLGDHVGDAPLDVAYNRQLLAALLPAEPLWLNQVHGVEVVDADAAGAVPRADACIARRSGPVCAVMTADCLPVLLCDERGTVVGAAHAGWRGLCAGVIERTVAAMGVPPRGLMAWLGPAIGPGAFEVGGEVRDAFIAADPQAQQAFVALPGSGGKHLADIFLLARQRLAAAGVSRVHASGDGERGLCTHSDATRFYSYRRDGATGRMGTFIWLRP